MDSSRVSAFDTAKRARPQVDHAEAAVAGAVTLEPVVADDTAFLFAVFASTRTTEMALTSWTTVQKQQFLSMQFEAQRRSYAVQFPRLEHHIVRHNGVAAGRMMVHRSGDEILLVDLALLPEHRNQGIGSRLLARLMEEASRGGKSVRLHVERFNSALRWYERLGFRIVGEGAIYLEMTWRPDGDTWPRNDAGLKHDDDQVE
jgi:ribosomal protein S18 acetylase RimI-like enzyme